MAETKYDIFISYRRAGGAQYARILQLMLIQRGYNVFLDYDELTDGKFGDHIADAIKEAPIFMLVLSEKALERCKNDGDWVRQEITLAAELGKKIIPVDPDSSFDGVSDDLPEVIREVAGTNQHSEINFGQTLGVTIDFMVDKRIAPVVGKRNTSDHVDTDFDAAKESLRKLDEHHRFMRRLAIAALSAMVLIVLAVGGIFLHKQHQKTVLTDKRTELESKYKAFNLQLLHNLSMTQMQTVDNILSTMSVVRPDTLWMSQFEFTVGQWYGVLDTVYDENQRDMPMTNISFGEVAMRFLDTLRNMTNINFDLPTPEEWEYAAHGGSHHETTAYAGSDDVDAVAWYAGNSSGKAHPSDGRQGKQPNWLDLFDMSGNVAELCNGPFLTPDGKVLWTVCGGHYNSPANEVAIESRTGLDPSDKHKTVGFRLVIRNEQSTND